MNKSFQLVRTNPRLTTNIKIVVDSKYNLYFESFNSTKELSNDKYKHYLLNREAILENEIPKFYAELPKNIAFEPRTQDDVDVMYDEYRQQFDNTYYSGANEVEDQSYEEEFEYFAPLYFRKNNLPKNFIIFRVDNPGIYVQKDDDYTLDFLNKDNFKEEIIDKWKCVKVFDLTNNTNLGKFFDRNINNNSRFPNFSLFFDTKPYNYSKWSGIDYNTGVYNTAELFLDDKLFYSNGHFNLEEFITTGFEKNSLIYPYILNLKFLFDDKRGTPSEMLTWSMNRYYGFYVEDLELVKTITSKKLPQLKTGLTIKNNIFLFNDEYVNPFVLNLTDNQWIQVENDFYEVKRQINGSFKIISDRNLTGFDVSTFKNGDNRISFTNSKNYIFNIDDFDKYLDVNGEEKDMYADVYLIEIDDIFHILKKDEDNEYYIHSDYAITSNDSILQYWKGGMNSKYSVLKDVMEEDGRPLSYKIYRVKFSDIKDFDFDRIVTKYSDFDYEKTEYYETPEIKLYATEYRDNSIPKRIKTHNRGEDGQYKPMNISSEYSACDETFEIRNDKLTPMFEKNQSICKWGYDGSISHSDYLYKLNNNFNCGGVWNRTVNTDLKVANIKEKTLDYFYRIGEFYSKNTTPFFIGNFEGNIEDDWENFDNSLWSYGSGWLIFYDDSTSPLKTETIDLIKNLEIGIFYEISFSVFITTGSPINYGVDPSSFLNGGYNTASLNPINFTFIGISISNIFKFFITYENDPDLIVIITELTITKLSNKYYLNQSTNIQLGILKNYDTINILNRFNLELYINSDFDYFDFFFKNNMVYEDGGKLLEKPYLKYSIFGGGDDELPASTLFKGIEYNLYNIDDIVLNQVLGLNQTIRTINTLGGNEYNGYKFSVILSENYNYYKFDKNTTGDYINGELVSNVNESIFGNNLLLNSQLDGIHIFLNKKYKNVLVIINKNIPFNLEWGTINYIDKFGETFGLYNGKTLDGFNFLPITVSGVTEYNPSILTAHNYIESLNSLNTITVYDTYINYYMIDEEGNFAKTEMVRFNDIEGNDRFRDLSNWDKKYPPFYFEVSTSSSINLKNNSYIVTPLKGPEANIYDKYLVYSDRRPIKESFINQPLARKIEKNEVDETKNTIFHGEKISNFNTINRFLGYYEPIFKDLNIFTPTYYWSDIDVIGSIQGNYSFNTSIEQFGVIDEIMYSKVNEVSNYLKLRNVDTDRSYYPMVDEVGVSQTDRFVFLSPWDRNFYLKTLNEQTFLQDYVQTPLSVVETPTFAEILSSTIVDGFDDPLVTYTQDINVYGWQRTLDNNFPNSVSGFTYSVTIKNLSSSSKTFGFRMNFVSSFGSTITIYSGTTSTIQSNQSETINFVERRPSEIKTGLPRYPLRILYNIRYVCFDISNPSVDLDSYQVNTLMVYNDLVNPILTGATFELGLTGNHQVNNSFDFDVILTDGESKVTYDYTAKLYIERYTGGFWMASQQTGSKISVVDKNIKFTVNLNNSELGLPSSNQYFAKIRFEVIYNYTIEGKSETEENLLEIDGYKIINIISR